MPLDTINHTEVQRREIQRREICSLDVTYGYARIIFFPEIFTAPLLEINRCINSKPVMRFSLLESSQEGEKCGLVKTLSINIPDQKKTSHIVKSKRFKLVQKKKEYPTTKYKYYNNNHICKKFYTY